MSIYPIALLSLLNHTGFSGSRVLMSLYALYLGADQLVIGIIMALYALCPMLLAVHAGKIVDRVGPRLPMLIGTSGVMIGLLLPFFFPGLATLYVSALVMGTAYQFFFVAVQGTAGAIGAAAGRVRNYTILSIGFSLAIFFGPMIAGFSIDYLGYLAAFITLAVFTVPAVLLLWLRPGLLPKAAAGAAQEQQGRSAFDLLRLPRLRNTFIASGLLSAAWDLYQFYFPIYGNAIGLSASVIGLVMGAFAAAVFVVRIALPHLTRRLTEFEILVYAIAVAGASFLLFPLFEQPFLLAAVSFLLGLGVGCGQPISGALIYHLSPGGRAAEGAGMRVMFNNFAQVVVPLLFGGVGTALGSGPVFVSFSALLLSGSYYSFRSGRAAAA